MVGTGVFLNTLPICQLLGTVGWVAYVLTGLVMIPIISVTYKLACRYPGYNMMQLLSLSFKDKAFFATMMYSLGKLGTAAIGFFFMAKIVSGWFSLPLFLAIILLLVMVYLLLYYSFTINQLFMMLVVFLKLSVIIAIVCYFGYLYYIGGDFCPGVFSSDSFLCPSFYGALGQGVSITVFAFAGFESLFAISHLLGDKKQGGVVLGCAFIVSLCFYVLYQYVIGYIIAYYNLVNFGEGFMALVGHIGTTYLSHSLWQFILVKYIEFAIFLASFGVTYGVLYANINNVHSSFINLLPIRLHVSRNVVFLFVSLYIVIGCFNIFYVQQFSTLATVILYGLFVWQFYDIGISTSLSIAGFASVLLFLAMHIYNAMRYFGFCGYWLYGLVFLFVGIVYCLIRRVKG